MQSIGLALKGADGKGYTFRTLDKDPTQDPSRRMEGLVPGDDLPGPDDREPSRAARSSCRRWPRRRACPHTNPAIVFMPDDPALGEFRETFGGKPGTIDEYPTPAGGGYPGFQGATEILSTARALGALAEGRGAGRHAGAPPRAHLRPLHRGLGPPQRPVALDEAARARRAGGAARGPRPGLLELLGRACMALARTAQPRLRGLARRLRQPRGPARPGPRGRRLAAHGPGAAGVRGDGARRAGPAHRRRDRGGRAPAAAGMVRRSAGRGPHPRPEEAARPAARGRRGLLRAAGAMGRRAGHGPGRRGAPDARGGRERGPGAVAGGRRRAPRRPYFRRRFLPEETKEVRVYLYGGADRFVATGPRGRHHACASPAGRAGTASTTRRAAAPASTTWRRARWSRAAGTGVSTRAVDAEPYKAETPWMEKQDFGSMTPLPAAHLVGAGPGDRALDGRHPLHATASASSPTPRCSTWPSSTRPSAAAFGGSYTGDFRWARPGFATCVELSADGAKNYNFYGFGNETARRRATSSTRPTRRSSRPSPRSSPTRTAADVLVRRWVPR